MITKEKILKNLSKYDYQFVENTNSLIIKLDFSHQVSIDFMSNGQIIIKDKLVHWNFLTGGISMSLKNAMIYNFIGIVVFTGLSTFEFSGNFNLNLIPFFIGYVAWVLMFTAFYNIKLESFKVQIITWTNE
ncbi:hypothetical protein [Flavobacterium sp.]|uniref:hypothetical protein n=1 Tax=Flavobacterium sp. TaxID=239 RepID=UPI0037532A6B